MTSDLDKLRIDKSGKSAQARGGKSRIRLAAAILVAAAIVAAFFAFSPSSHTVEAGKAAMAYPSRALTLLTASGYVVAERKASLATKATARLVWIGVEEGSTAKRGDIVARLENEDVTAALERAVAQLETARHRISEARAEVTDAALHHTRMSRLVKNDYVARSEHDSATARKDKAAAALAQAETELAAREAAVAEARANLEYTLIRVPFNAVVLTKNADVGDIISPLGASANAKAAVVSIADLSSLQVEVDVSESNLAKVRQGEPCEITLDAYPDERFQGMVHMIVPTADRTKATVMVKIRFHTLDPRIMPEMSAKAAFLSRPLGPGEDVPRLAVPARAVTKRDGRDVVYRITDGRAELLEVTVTAPLGDMVEVSGPVSPGDRLVLSPPASIKNGDAIDIKEG
ncbi:efflux RND transporter periplasmic adaptor subunit [Desulfolutivibrio sulfoxidireducens]|uniref:efflux RND transporter periplasmic adaptor subunit n=1 Tax=Desulfolutivibrio sulfoxidireducens TaxID=2773299 RepID=UPI00159E8B92|nr:efflux RND transporter periplasmic adaptor subunit [Desulfolutivibrio sulfoxidireducens]QLA19599.1 efflux RND transporter periplasmic adaptor subunit [Desulfolutivibrio sulfoxidireducens]